MLDVPCERYSFTYELPEREIIVYADRRRIEQVLENLISNAKKYVCENGNIHLTVKQENSAIYFSVFNQGNTIPEQEISQICQSSIGENGRDKVVMVLASPLSLKY